MLKRVLRGGLVTGTIAAISLVPAAASFALPAPPAGTITTVMGTGRFNGDNRSATSASLAMPFGQNFQTSTGLGGVIDIAGFNPAGITVDQNGYLYIADRNNNRIRRVTPGVDGTLRTGNITTVAGTGAAGFSGDGGQATAAALNAPSDVAVAPDGTMYIADLSNRRVRKVTPQGVISTYAGNGLDRIGPDGVIATQASIREPTHIALGADGSLYVTDRPGNQVRKVAPDGTISVFAGRGTPGGNLGEGERAQDATLDGPVGITVLPTGEVVFSDRNNQRIKLVDNAGNLFTIAGSGRTGDGQTLTDTRYGEFEPNFTPRLNDNCSGLGVQPGLPCATANRDAPSARFDRPLGVAAAPDGSIYIADQQDHVVRRLAPKSVINEVFDLPGSGRSGQELRDFTDPSNRTIYRIYTVSGVRIRPNTLNTTQTRTGPTGFDAGAFIAGDSGSSDGQRALSTAMRNPSDVAVAGNGDLYILDQGNQRVLWVPNPNNVNALNFRVAGPFVGNSGDPRSTQLMNPRHVLAAPDGALLVADSDRSVVRRIEPDGGFADVIAGTGNRGGFFDDDTGAATSIPLGWPTGLAMGPDGSLYIADRGRHMIFRVKDGQLSRFAGTGRADFLGPSGFSPEGRPARDEPLYSPSGVAVAPDGTVYIADTLNSRLRRVDTGGNIFTIAGTGAYGYNGDGKDGNGTQLFQPTEVKVGPDGAVYFADTGNAVIRKWTPTTGVVNIVAGTGGQGGFGGDGGRATAAQLNNPDGFAFGPDGSLFVADTTNNRVRKVAPDGNISTIAGTGTNGETGDGGAATAALLRGPRSVSVDAQGNVFVADTENNRIRMIAPGGDGACRQRRLALTGAPHSIAHAQGPRGFRPGALSIPWGGPALYVPVRARIAASVSSCCARSPRSTLPKSSTIRSAVRRLASRVRPAMCGVCTTLARPRRGSSAGRGSTSYTSSAAASSSATTRSRRAPMSTARARVTITTSAPRRRRPIRSRSSSRVADGVGGTVTKSTSHSATRASTSARRTPHPSAIPSGRYGSYPSTCPSNPGPVAASRPRATHQRATRPPICPSPITPTRFVPSSPLANPVASQYCWASYSKERAPEASSACHCGRRRRAARASSRATSATDCPQARVVSITGIPRSRSAARGSPPPVLSVLQPTARRAGAPARQRSVRRPPKRATASTAARSACSPRGSPGGTCTTSTLPRPSRPWTRRRWTNGQMCSRSGWRAKRNRGTRAPAAGNRSGPRRNRQGPPEGYAGEGHTRR